MTECCVCGRPLLAFEAACRAEGDFCCDHVPAAVAPPVLGRLREQEAKMLADRRDVLPPEAFDRAAGEE